MPRRRPSLGEFRGVAGLRLVAQDIGLRAVMSHDDDYSLLISRRLEYYKRSVTPRAAVAQEGHAG